MTRLFRTVAFAFTRLGLARLHSYSPARTVLLPLLLTLLVAGCGRQDGAEHSAEGNEERAAHEEEPEGPELVELSPEALKNANIATAEVSKRVVVDALTLPAEVQAHPDNIAHITPLVASQVSEVRAKPGDRVKKGQTLVLLKSIEVGEARADIARTKAALAVAQDQLERQQQLMEEGIGAQKSYVVAKGAAREAKAALAAAYTRADVYGGGGGAGSTIVVRSPLDGTVIARHATAGEVAGPERELFVIANTDPVWIVGRAYETELANVSTGMTALVRVKSYPDRSWQGTVSYVSPTLDERTRTAEIRVELPNPEGTLRPGMFATLSPVGAATDAGTKAATTAVPVGAIQRDGDRFLAFVVKSDNQFEPRVVKPGARGSEFLEVLSGLAEGEKVVVEGTFLLKSEAAKREMGGGHSH